MKDTQRPNQMDKKRKQTYFLELAIFNNIIMIMNKGHFLNVLDFVCFWSRPVDLMFTRKRNIIFKDKIKDCYLLYFILKFAIRSW